MKDVKKLKIAYIGGGSRNWARNLMNDLAMDGDIGGDVDLYDIDYEAACDNAVIGNKLSSLNDVVGKWQYRAVKNLSDALITSDFVVISILPASFDEMESDVHAPEKYGIYQSVGDTVGAGGVVRALRTVPMFVDIANAVKKFCPNAWVINFTNPMTVCVRALYKAFPEIKAFGCCHEVFGTQKLFAGLIYEKYGIEVKRDDIKVNVLGVNHFTWVDSVKYRGENLLPLFDEAIEKHPDGMDHFDLNWANRSNKSRYLVTMDLYKRYGLVPAAGDRHLAEFCPGKWYLKDPATVDSFGFDLTTVSSRKAKQKEKIAYTKELVNGTKELTLKHSGEESVRQIKALLGIGDFVTNVNVPNKGQLEGFPLESVVETNAYFSGDDIHPIFAGKLPTEIHSLVSRVVDNQETVVEAAMTGDYELAFKAFINDANMNLPLDDARKLYDEMLYNTREYLPAYDKYVAQRKNK